MTDKTLAIVIPVLNNWGFTNKTISSLVKLPETHKIIIVDNGSSDDTVKLTTTDRLEIIRNSKNIGFGAACNQGFKLAVDLGYSNVMFLNNDVSIIKEHDSWTEEIIKKAGEGKVVGPTIGCLDNNFNFVCESNKIPTKLHWYVSGWNITASVETWNKLILDGEYGPWSTEFFVYFEDTDLGFRIRQQSIPCEVVYIPVRHFGKATSSKLGISGLYQKSRAVFVNKWTNSKLSLAVQMMK
jgi:GT2 family glycosyltransferase